MYKSNQQKPVLDFLWQFFSSSNLMVKLLQARKVSISKAIQIKRREKSFFTMLKLPFFPAKYLFLFVCVYTTLYYVYSQLTPRELLESKSNKFSTDPEFGEKAFIGQVYVPIILLH